MTGRRKRLVATVVAAAAVSAAAASLIARANEVTNLLSLGLAAGSPYFVALAVAGVALAAWSRKPILAAIGSVIVTVGLATQFSWYFLSGEPGTLQDKLQDKTIRVLSSNIRAGDVDASAFVDLARENADLIVVVELTPDAVRRLTVAGIGRDFPHSHLIPAPLAGGIGMWSRFPLTPVSVLQHSFAAAPAAVVEVPGVRLKPRLIGVHVKSPLAEGRDTVADWRGGVAHVKDQLARFATGAGQAAVIVAGDFNCTPDVRQFRDLLADGYHDAVEQLGAGFSPTFPAGGWHPPLFAIDHVLTRNAPVSSIKTVDVAGSDHRALLASVSLPAAV